MPFANLEELRVIESIVEHYLKLHKQPTHGSLDTLSAGDWSPAANIGETELELLVEIELPDIKKENIKVSVDQGILRIEGARKFKKIQGNQKYHRLERDYGTFLRSFTLPFNVNETRINASLENGLLSLRIPKLRDAIHKEIEVKIN